MALKSRRFNVNKLVGTVLWHHKHLHWWVWWMNVMVAPSLTFNDDKYRTTFIHTCVFVAKYMQRCLCLNMEEASGWILGAVGQSPPHVEFSLRLHQIWRATLCSPDWTGSICRTRRCRSSLSRRTKPTRRTSRRGTALSTSPCLGSACRAALLRRAEKMLMCCFKGHFIHVQSWITSVWRLWFD